MNNEVIPEATELEAELVLLRGVYDAARRVLRFSGVDLSRMYRAASEMDEAIERVKEFDGGCMEHTQLQQLVTGCGSYSQVYLICHAYESGFGHGLQLDGLNNELRDTFADARQNEAYCIGYRRGARVATTYGTEAAQRALKAHQAAMDAEAQAHQPASVEHTQQVNDALGLRQMPALLLPVEQANRLTVLSASQGVVVQAVLRQLLSELSDEQIVAAARQVKATSAGERDATKPA